MNLPAANLPGGASPITQYTPAVNYSQVLNSSGPFFASFHLDQFPDYLMYTSIYDLYRISKIEVEFRPNINVHYNISNTSTAGTTYQTEVGRIPWYCWVDISPTNTNEDQNAYHSINNLHQWYYDDTYKLHFWPKPEEGLQLTGGTNQAGAGPSTDTSNWIDCAYPTIVHNGLQVFPGANTTGTLPKLATDNSVVNMWVRMWVEFKFNE